MPHSRFRITKGQGDEYTFNLTAANGEKILSSERYASHSGATRGVAAVKENAVVDARYERRDARDGTVYFVLKAGNGEIVGTSEMYSGSSARERGIESVKVNAPVAGVEG
jgi:uncharacterized protein YegP (UPF0339 family)